MVFVNHVQSGSPNSMRKPTQVGVVTERLPNLQYRIELETGEIIRAFLSGKMKINRINVLVGDRVRFEIDTLGENNRIVERL